MKNILFGSVVAAALIFSGCGSSSSSGGDSNTSKGAGAGNDGAGAGNDGAGAGNDGAGAGNDGAGAGNDGAGAGSSTYPGDTVTIGGVAWTVLHADKDDANVSKNEIDGKLTQANADAQCTEWGMEMATQAQIEGNATELKKSAKFRSDAGDALVVWYKDKDLTGYFFNGVDTNISEDTDSYNDTDWTSTSTNNYTCIKK